MKKLFLGVSILVFMASCSGNGVSEKTSEDSVRIADSLAQIEAVKEQACQDSIRRDSIAKVEKATQEAAQFDDLIKEYASAIVTFKNRAIRTNGDYKSYQLYLKCQNIEAKLNKNKNKMTSEQLSKFNSEKSKLRKYVIYIEP